MTMPTFSRLLPRLLRSLSGGPCSAQSGVIEVLEQRSLLANSPLPTLADMENANHSVVRFETNFGDIDIEMFDDVAPITVANFLNYVRSGRLDETVFHRLSKLNDPAPLGGLDVIQGGGFGYDNAFGGAQVSADPAIVNEVTGRSNVRGTLSMARLQAADSATSQFFINFQSNTTLDRTASFDGYAVFGKIIKGIENTDAIAALTARDFSSETTLGSVAGAFGNTPVTSAFNAATGVRENVLVSLINAEVIKPSEIQGFYSTRVVSPEGFLSSTTSEWIDLVNPNAVAGRYQVIARYEAGGNNDGFVRGTRDKVLAMGSIAANSSATVQLTSTDAAFTDLTRGGGYSIILETALPQVTVSPVPIVGTIRRDDFGASTSAALLAPGALADADKRSWTFGRIERDALSRSFILLYNTSDTAASVTATFTTPQGTRTITRDVEAYRRGGIDLALETSLPEGVLSVRVVSTQNILVSMSDWDLPSAGVPVANANTPGWLVNGTNTGGSNIGALASVSFSTASPGVISLANPNTAASAVTLIFYPGGSGTPVSTTQALLSRTRTDLDLSTITGLVAGQRYAVVYTSTRAITAQFTNVPETGRHGAGEANNRLNGVSTSFLTKLTTASVFSGSFDPNRANDSQREVISIWAPMVTDVLTSINYNVEYLFADGTRIAGTPGTLGTANRIDINTGNNAAVLSKIATGAQFRTYAILVTGTATSGSTTVQTTPGVVQLSRFDTTTGKSTVELGSNAGTGLVSFDSPPGG